VVFMVQFPMLAVTSHGLGRDAFITGPTRLGAVNRITIPVRI
jgi:hypothetical protein